MITRYFFLHILDKMRKLRILQNIPIKSIVIPPQVPFPSYAPPPPQQNHSIPPPSMYILSVFKEGLAFGAGQGFAHGLFSSLFKNWGANSIKKDYDCDND